MITRRENIKALIELSTSFEEADEVIEQNTNFKTFEEKIAFLNGMFDVEVIDRKSTDSPEYIYTLMLNSIVEVKWL